MNKKMFFIGLMLVFFMTPNVYAKNQIPDILLNQKLKLNVPFTTQLADWRMSSKDEAKVIADNFIKNNEVELGISSENFKYLETIFSKNSDYDYLNPSGTVRYAQYYGNIPVFEAGLSLTINAYGVIVGFAAVDFERVIKNITAPTTPIITSEDSIKIAKERYNQPELNLEKAPELFIYKNKLAWRLYILQPVFKEVMIDSQNGGIILERVNITNPIDTENQKQTTNIYYYIIPIIVVLSIFAYFVLRKRT